MARLVPRDELPHLTSTRDTRDRVDLVTDAVDLGATALRADRIVYHPGDDGAKHFHLGCDHAFHVLAGSGVAHVDDETHRVEAGDTIVVREGETHWFENDGDMDFAFVEIWAPPPRETVWVVDGDACTWRPQDAEVAAEGRKS
jgi:mannose-6-phosphate isomerase-like protein (cupin superfamily)